MPPRSRRPARRTSSRVAALRAACGCAASALAVGAAFGALFLVLPPLRTDAPLAVAAESPTPDLAGIRALVLRTMRAGGAADAGAQDADDASPSPGTDAWTGALARGELALADLLLRGFTGTRYLLAGADDAAFAADVHAAVLDRAPTAAEAADAAAALASGDRLTFLARFLARPDVAAFCAGLGVSPGTIPAEALVRAKAGGSPAGAIAAAVAEPLPPDGGYAFGTLGSRGTVDLGGLDGRVDFLVDRRVANQAFAGWSGEGGDAAGPQAYAVSWDADLEAPGLHATAVLARRADGRGLRIDGGTYAVPRLRDLEAGAVVDGTFAEDGAHDFYRVASGGGWNALRVLADGTDGVPAALPALRAFRRAGDPLDAAVSSGDGVASLGVRTEAAGTIYLQVSRTSADTVSGAGARAAAAPAYRAVLDADFAVVRVWTAAATLRDAPGSASDAAGTLADGTVAALLGEGTDPDGDLWYRVRTADAEGYVSVEQVRPVRFAGRLAALSIDLPGGGAAGLAPAFDAETPEYGLVLPADAASVDLSFLAREGALAEASAAFGPESGDAAPLDLSGDAAAIPVPQGPSVLRLSVASADRASVRTYVVHLYRPSGTDGFDATLEAVPPSYRSALWLLRTLHPGWTFDAFRTGIRFDDFLAAEGHRDRCLLPEGQVPASFLEPGSPVYDGTTWKAASDAAIARFADPRVFLSERDVFQFERLAFLPDVQTEEGVAAILSGSFFDDPTVDADGTTVDFARLFYEAGRDAGASPYFLASRSLQEMGRTGTPLSFGTVPGHEGYFNYFNIGSLPDPSVPNGAQINGALFAQYGWLPAEAELTAAERAILLPWTTRALAVRGGSRHIASRYIAVGQDTQYLQKFDLIPDTGLYTHQYMQNLLAPRNESRRMFRAYRATGLLDVPFAFRIPVFEAMPDAPAPEP